MRINATLPNVKDFKFIANKNWYVITRKGHIEFHDIQSDRLDRYIKNKHDHIPYFSPDYSLFAKITQLSINLWSVQLQVCVKILRFSTNAWTVCFSECNKFLVVTVGGEIKIFDISTITTECVANKKTAISNRKPLAVWKTELIPNKILFYNGNVEPDTLIYAIENSVVICNWKTGKRVKQIFVASYVEKIWLHRNLLFINDAYQFDMSTQSFENIYVPPFSKSLLMIGNTLYSLCIDNVTAELYDIRKRVVVYAFKLYRNCNTINLKLIDVCGNYFTTCMGYGCEIWQIINFKILANVVTVLKSTTATYVMLDICNFLEANKKRIDFQTESNCFLTRKLLFIENLKFLLGK